MTRVLVSATAIAGVMMSVSTIAGKVNMPKEGSYEFVFCVVGSLGGGEPAATIEESGAAANRSGAGNVVRRLPVRRMQAR